MILEPLLAASGIYLLCGMAFAVPFLVFGVARIDRHAVRASRGFRLLIVPGTMFFWPLLAWRWMKGIQGPLEEQSPHRNALRGKEPS